MKDSNADQKIKSENILLLSCLRTERKTSEHIVHVRWKRGGWVKVRDHGVFTCFDLLCWEWVSECLCSGTIKQLNGLSPDPQNPKDYAQAFLPSLLPSLTPSIHPFIHSPTGWLFHTRTCSYKRLADYLLYTRNCSRCWEREIIKQDLLL